MSRLQQRNLAIVVVVAGALLAGTALLANYTGILRADAQEQTQVAPCGQAKPCAGTATEAAGFPNVYASVDAAPGEACCAAKKAAGTCDKLTACCGERPEACCGKPIACCEEEPEGCCGKPQTGCCEQPVPGCCEKPESGDCCVSKVESAAN